MFSDAALHVRSTASVISLTSAFFCSCVRPSSILTLMNGIVRPLFLWLCGELRLTVAVRHAQCESPVPVEPVATVLASTAGQESISTPSAELIPHDIELLRVQDGVVLLWKARTDPMGELRDAAYSFGEDVEEFFRYATDADRYAEGNVKALPCRWS